MPLQYNGTVQLGNVHHSPRAQIRVKIAKAFHLKFKRNSGAGGGRVGEEADKNLENFQALKISSLCKVLKNG